MALPKNVDDREFKKFEEDTDGNVAIRVLVKDASGRDILKNEDDPHVTGDPGVQMLTVRQDSATALGGSDGDYQPLITDSSGRLHVSTTISRNSPVVISATGAGAISVSTSIAANFILKSLTVHLSAAPTTSEDLTLTLNALDGSAYDAVLYRTDLSNGSKQDILFTPDGDLTFESGDELILAFTNTDTVTYGVRIVVEAI